MKPTICIISPRSYPLLKDHEVLSQGGAEAQLKMLGFELARRGFDIHYIVDDYGQHNHDQVGDMYIHKCALKYMGGSNLYIIPAWAKLFFILLKINADIHLIKIPRDLLLPLGIYKLLMKKKLIFIGQMDRDVNPGLLKKENFFSYIFYRLGLMFVDHIVAQNERQKKGFLVFSNKQATIIKSFQTLPDKKKLTKKNYILWVGSNFFKKQPEKFLKLAWSLPQYQFKMIMSTTPQNMDDRPIREEAKLISNLEYLGFVPFGKISKYFQNASLFISTSLQEGFPNTFLQSWQYGTPVISLNIDPDGVIKNYQLGRKSKTITKLRENVIELMENKELRKALAANSKEYVRNHHSQDVILPQYLKLFNACLQK